MMRAQPANQSATPIMEQAPRIVVFGVGGAGGNAVDNMIQCRMDGVEFIAANTDSQALSRAQARTRLQLGPNVTKGLGAGADPERGAEAAEDAVDLIREQLQDAHIVFITAGLGGGTGTGAAPIIAREARALGVLTVAVVTKPFAFEGSHRMSIAQAGLEKLRAEVDTLIVVPNQNLFRVADEQTSFSEAFALADEVLHAGVRGVTDLITRPGYINLDFADVRTVLFQAGVAMMGVGEAAGPDRARDAARAAVSNPLLDDVTLAGAKSVLINVTAGRELTLYEMDQAANEVRAEADPNASIIIGSAFEEALGDVMRVAVLATGMDDEVDAVVTPVATRPDTPPAPVEPPVDDSVDDEPLAPSRPVAEPEAAERRGGGFPFIRRRPKAATPPPPPQAPVEPDEAVVDRSEDDEDLEIPAFLRRKAG